MGQRKLCASKCFGSSPKADMPVETHWDVHSKSNIMRIGDRRQTAACIKSKANTADFEISSRQAVRSLFAIQ
jgi:hypothetical protein